MAKSLIIAENASLAALMDRGKAVEIFVQSSDFALGDIYCARVENILPSIDAVFLNLGSDKMGFLHASDIPGTGPLTERVWPRQKMLVQIVKETTGNKGPRVSTDITLIGRFFVLTTEHQNVVMSRRITSMNERARLRSIATLIKPPVGFGLIIRTEAMGATEEELEEDFRELFIERWKYIIDQFEIQRHPKLLFSDSRDLLYRVLRDVFHDGVDKVYVDNQNAADRAKHYLELWSHNPPAVNLLPPKQLMEETNLMNELKSALSHKIELPSGGYLYIQPTEALTVVDVNSGKFTSSRSPEETVLRTNIEAATEAARQLRLRNIGGVIVIDFIDMESKFHRLTLLEHFEKLLENDPAHPQIGRLSDLGLVELTRHRQEKSLFEALGHLCDKCHGAGWIFPIFTAFDDDKPQQQHEDHYHQEPQYRDENEERIFNDSPYPEQNYDQQQPQGDQPYQGGGNYQQNDRYNRRGAGSGRNNNQNRRQPNRRNPHQRGPNPRHQGGGRYNEHRQSPSSNLEEQLIRSISQGDGGEQVDNNNYENPTENANRNYEEPQQNSYRDTHESPQPEIKAPPQEPISVREERKTVELPTISFENQATKEVLPGIYSFSNDEDQ